MDREQARRAASRARGLLLLVAATLAITVCVPSPATAGTGAPTPAAGGGASTATGGSTRYVDPIFAGALAPTVHASYDPTYALNKRHTLTVAGMGGSFTLTVNGSTTAPLPPSATAGQIQAALRALPTTNLDGVPGGDVVVFGGPGGWAGGDQFTIAFNVSDGGTGYPAITADGAALTNVGNLPATAAAQCNHCLDVYQPQEAVAPAGGRPVIVVLHGGSFVGGAKDSAGGDSTGARMEEWSRQLASRGYVVVPINYTLSDPSALMPTTCDWDGAAGPVCPPAWYEAVADVQHDAQAAIRWLRKGALPASSGGSNNPYRIDPNHVMVVGESAGAFAALNVLYKPDDPGTVGVTTGSSSVSAAASLAGMMIDTDQRPGAGPALLLEFTNDPLGEVLGIDLFEQSRQVLARANTVGNLVDLEGYCRKIVPDGAAEEHPVHLIPTDQPEFADQVARVSRFFNDRVLTAPVSTVPAPAIWKGGTPPSTFAVRGGQSLYGHHEPVVGDFDGDGQADVIWYGAGHECDTAWFGSDHQTFFDPKEVFGTAYTPALEVEGNYVATVGDYDADGRDDVVWYDAADGAVELWYGNGDRTFQKSGIATLPTNLVLSAGDVDADGHDDLLITSPSVAGAILTFGDVRGSFVQGTVLGGINAGLTPVLGDFDGDGHADVYWRGATGNQLWFGVGRAGAASFETEPAPASIGTSASRPPLVGDLDGDGADDLFWYVSGVKTAIWYGPAARAPFVPGLITVVTGFDAAGGDFDGDGRADVLFHSPSGPDYLWIGVADRAKGVSMRGAGADVGAGFVATAGPFSGTISATGNPVADVLWDPTT